MKHIIMAEHWIKSSMNKDLRYVFDTKFGILYALCRYNSDAMEEYRINEYCIHYHKEMFWSSCV
jgi:hypothetical protein